MEKIEEELVEKIRVSVNFHDKETTEKYSLKTLEREHHDSIIKGNYDISDDDIIYSETF